jgi:hypothetical protein
MPALILSPIKIVASLPQTDDQAEIADQIATMRIQEETAYLIRDYLADSLPIRKMTSEPVDEDCRVKMCQWGYRLIDYCRFRRETVGIGMSYLDRFLCTLKGREALYYRKEYQLAAMTAIYIAIKLHESLNLDISLIAELSEGCCTEMEFVRMERTILHALKWRFNDPIVIGFVQRYMVFLPSTVQPAVCNLIFDYARYQTELAVSDQKLVAIKPSELAFAAVLNAIEGLDDTLLPLKARRIFTRSTEIYADIWTEDIECTQSRLAILLLETMGGDYSKLVRAMVEEEEKEFEEKRGKLVDRCGLSPVSVVSPSSFAHDFI